MIQLSSDLQEFVDAQVAAGAYQAPEDVVQDALRLLAEQKARERDEVVAAIQSSITDMEAGHGTPLSQVDAELREKFGFAKKTL